jgi:hypothetical protein
MTTRVPACECPVCGRTMDAATDVLSRDNVPEAGDLSVCLYCCTVLVFTPELKLRLAGGADFDSLAPADKAYLAKMILAILRAQQASQRQH